MKILSKVAKRSEGACELRVFLVESCAVDLYEACALNRAASVQNNNGFKRLVRAFLQSACTNRIGTVVLSGAPQTPQNAGNDDTDGARSRRTRDYFRLKCRNKARSPREPATEDFLAILWTAAALGCAFRFCGTGTPACAPAEPD